MFTKSAAFYDAIYSFKDYAGEAQKLHTLIQERLRSGGNTLLDVACGTGVHSTYLTVNYAVEGLDLDENLLAIARSRLPDIPLHHADMRSFELGKQFDVIVCLFSSIGYIQTVDNLNLSLRQFAQHTRPGGLVIVEPWFEPGFMRDRHTSIRVVDEPDLKIARTTYTRIQDQRSFMEFQYLVATPDGIEHFTEMHVMGLFTRDEYLTAFTNAGLDVSHDPEGLDGRGLYIGLKP